MRTIKERMEQVPVIIMEGHGEMARAVAHRIAAVIRERNAEGRNAVLGLATGSTPIGVYRELIRLHREEGLDFSGVVTFNLDEYYPMQPESPHSYVRFMWENLFQDINIPPENVHIPDGTVPKAELDRYCAQYETEIREAGGIDFQLLGIGRSGHIGFNEPGSPRESRTHLVFLDTITRADAASDFFGEENVPLEALTMGVASILDAREVVLLATGEHKAVVVKRAVEGEVHADVAATYLQEHPNATIYLDPAAAAGLTRVATPWLLGDVEWTLALETEAVIWLSQEVGKSILRLSTRDYRDHHLSSLVARHGSAGPLNGEVFNRLISKIRGKSKLPAGKRVLVFSPHPDDDVISMGGILRKLANNANEVTVAYQTSGNIAVFDHEVRRYLDFVERGEKVLGGDTVDIRTQIGKVRKALARKPPGEMDIPEVLELKRVIRETEAVSALESVGLGAENARFLNLPFYQTGKVRKDLITQADVDILVEVLDEIRPELVFAAGDLSDPHGTHRMCLDAVRRALEEYSGPAPDLWLYRGAWQEWAVSEATVLVPLSESELRRKILAIFKHQSQKDKAPFPGSDEREFWQRTEQRNRGTADLLAHLGLPAYYAMEAFVVEREGKRLENPVVATSSLGVGG
ncbi:MAG: glucosamine-6-phosphate deaminase [Gemmatimonadota bacterium]|jgi:glucosamine-6-phosphate deaminase